MWKKAAAGALGFGSVSELYAFVLGPWLDLDKNDDTFVCIQPFPEVSQIPPISSTGSTTTRTFLLSGSQTLTNVTTEAYLFVAHQGPPRRTAMTASPKQRAPDRSVRSTLVPFERSRSEREMRRGRNRVAARWSGAVMASAWLVLAGSTAAAALGDLDPSFGEGGWAFTKVADYGRTDAALIQPDGRIIVVATSGTTMAVWRLLSTGEPDASFGVGGQATVSFERTSAARAAALQPDGKVLLAGFAGPRLAVVRVLSNGDLDSSFGDGDGRVTVRLVERAVGEDLSLLPDGRIIVGAALVTGRSRSPIGSALVRLTPEGGIDDGFGANGIVIDQDHLFGDLTLDGQGSVIVAFSSSWWRSKRFFVARYGLNGVPDPTFGGGGVRRYLVKGADEPNEVILDGDGRIVLALSGYADRCFLGSGAVVRLTSEGDLDTSFSDDGIALRRCILQQRILIQDDGNILVGGSMFAGAGSGEYYPTLARISAAGDPAIAFGERGVVIAPPEADYWSWTRGLLLQVDGKIILVAGAIYQQGFAVGRFLAA